MSKIYILDTNVFLHDPKALTAFQDNEVVIPLVVLDELDKKKSGPDEVARHARETIRALDEMRAKGSIHEGVRTDAGGVIRVELNHKCYTPTDLDPTRADNRIISVALGIMKERGPSNEVIVISKDINLRVKCDALGVYAEDYNTDSVAANPSSIYSGTAELTVDDNVINELYNQGTIDANFCSMHENQYALLRSNINPKHSVLARFESGRLIKITAKSNVWGISPRNKEQVCAMDALFDTNIKLVTLIGGAGAGKTLLAAASGISQLLDSYTYRRLLMSRPIVPMGRDLGYLPGDLNEKMRPWMAPLQDNLDLLFSDKNGDVLDLYRERGIIEVEALTYIRGRSIPKSFIIVDECLTKNHFVQMGNGAMKKIQYVTAGDEILSLNLESNTMEKRLVDGTINRKTNKIVKIKTSNALLECTPNHPLYIFKDFIYSKKAITDVNIGDFIVSPRKTIHIVDNNIDLNLAHFIGMILSDGHVEKNYRTIKVAIRKDKKYFNEFFRKGIVALIGKDKSRSFINSRGDFVINFSNKDAIKLFCDNYNIPSGNKSNIIKVPDSIFTCNLEAIKRFISGCFDAEGDININKQKSLIINYNTTSYEMVIGMQNLLNKFGIKSGLAIINRNSKNDKHSDIYRLYLTGKNAYSFYKNIGFCMDRKQNMLKRHFCTHIPLDTERVPIVDIIKQRLKNMGIKTRNVIFRDIYHSKTIYRYNINTKYSHLFTQEELKTINNLNFNEIKAINSEELCVEEDVYDFKVNKTGTFYVNGLISSNCQNLTRHEIKTIITRVGEGSKVVLTGDILQIDNPFIDSVDNGLSYVVEKFKHDKIAAHITLTKGERSELATKAAELL